MTKRTKKDLIYFSIGVFIFLALLFVIADIMLESSLRDYNMQNTSIKEKIRLFADIDSCLDDGYCKEGIPIEKDETGKIIYLNKDSCTKNNGKWNEEYKVCDFRNKE